MWLPVGEVSLWQLQFGHEWTHHLARAREISNELIANLEGASFIPLIMSPVVNTQGASYAPVSARLRRHGGQTSSWPQLHHGTAAER